MNYKLYYIFFVGVLFSCSEKNKSIEKASLELCNCFDGYTESDSKKMLVTIHKLDSIDSKIDFSAIPKDKLTKQMKMDCPDKISVIEKLLLFN
jgi:hypothetical protein